MVIVEGPDGFWASAAGAAATGAAGSIDCDGSVHWDGSALNLDAETD